LETAARWIPQHCGLRQGGDGFAKDLQRFRVEVREVKGKPGWYEAVAWLRPHFQLETLTTSMRLVAEVPKKS